VDSVIAGVVDIVGSIDRGGGCLCDDCGRLRVYGLDEVGMEIENVFQIMPMQQLAAAAQKDAGDQFVSEMPTLTK